MATDLTVVLPDRPGALAQLGEQLGNAGVNIGGLCCAVQGGQAAAHVLVEDAAAAKAALAGGSTEVSGEREVLVLDVDDRPGVLGDVSRRLADAGVNIEVVYLATGTRLVIGADDLNKARAAL